MLTIVYNPASEMHFVALFTDEGDALKYMEQIQHTFVDELHYKTLPLREVSAMLETLTTQLTEGK